MEAETILKSTSKKKVKTNETTSKNKKRGFVGMWKGKIKINGDIDNVFNNIVI